MVNQATALLMETGKALDAVSLPTDCESTHALRGFHRGESHESADAARDTNDSQRLDLLIELGRISLKLDDVRALRKGSVVVLDKSIDEPVAILAGSRLAGRGEIVLVDGKIGVRVVELVDAY